MEIRVLRYYLAVARELNITRAAESLHISQPSLSKQMMDLEDHIGKKLFIRGKRKIELTEDGILLKKRAEEIIELVQKTEDEMSQDNHILSGDLYLGGTAAKSILEEASILIEKYPHIQLHFYSNDAVDISERLNHGLLDFAVMLEPIDATKFNYLSLNEKTRWGVLMKKESPYSQLETITSKELKTMPLILHQRLGLQQRLAHWAQCDLKDLKIQATYNVINGSDIELVRSNLGYLLATNDHLTQTLDEDICFKYLEPELSESYALVWKKEATFSRVARAFFEQIKGK